MQRRSLRNAPRVQEISSEWTPRPSAGLVLRELTQVTREYLDLHLQNSAYQASRLSRSALLQVYTLFGQAGRNNPIRTPSFFRSGNLAAISRGRRRLGEAQSTDLFH